MAETLSEQLAEYRASWRVRVPADRQASLDQHVAHLAATGIGRSAKQVGDRAAAIRLPDQHGETFDVATLLAKGAVIVTFYRGGWCPFCNFELKACQAVLPCVAAAGASLVANSPEKPDDSVSTAQAPSCGRIVPGSSNRTVSTFPSAHPAEMTTMLITPAAS